uniref:Phospholipid/glycerol acyltransferase domain-containing protein n=1 Tax=Parascaris univalens TaxID=6257 RepID=A0A915C7P4_PARUN
MSLVKSVGRHERRDGRKGAAMIKCFHLHQYHNSAIRRGYIVFIHRFIHQRLSSSSSSSSMNEMNVIIFALITYNINIYWYTLTFIDICFISKLLSLNEIISR